MIDRLAALAPVFALLAFATWPAHASEASGPIELVLKVARPAGEANGEPLVLPDCVGSALKISPCQLVAATWLAHLNSRAQTFVNAYRAAGYEDEVTSATLDCSLGILNSRMTRDGTRISRHAFGEACDGNAVRINDVTFSYRRAVTDENSVDRRFFVAFLDGWGELGPGCIPEKGYTIFGSRVDCRPVMVDNCGVIDWRERGANSQYGATYHLSFCQYSNFERGYE